MIFTIGHSTRTLEELVALLNEHAVSRLADIRTIPRSRRHPHFARDALAATLPQHGILYAHFPGLGGLRRPRPGSINMAWRNDGFRGYADYMGTLAFNRALDELLASSAGANVALMCAEAVWWRCHRRLIADALVARDMEVFHIMSPGGAVAHRLSTFARVDQGRVTYPGEGLQPLHGSARLNG